MKKYYAGIGSRQTPENILALMEQTATCLASQGWTLRSGHAPGADSAFERGAEGKSELFLPWKTFGSQPVLAEKVTFEPPKEAFKIASKFHPVFMQLKPAHQLLLARNVQQILGADLNHKSNFVLCWTKGGKTVGGTGLALKIANEYNIEIFNLFDQEIQKRVKNMINQK